MSFEKGHEKAGGRVAGTPNKRTQQLLDRAREMGADPFEFLIKTMKGDGRELGRECEYEKKIREWEQVCADIDEDNETRKKKKPHPAMPVALDEHEIVSVNLIPIEERQRAARELMPYLYGKRKWVDSEGSDKSTFLSEMMDLIDLDGST